jgi:hypothetical protein
LAQMLHCSRGKRLTQIRDRQLKEVAIGPRLRPDRRVSSSILSQARRRRAGAGSVLRFWDQSPCRPIAASLLSCRAPCRSRSRGGPRGLKGHRRLREGIVRRRRLEMEKTGPGLRFQLGSVDRPNSSRDNCQFACSQVSKGGLYRRDKSGG